MSTTPSSASTNGVDSVTRVLQILQSLRMVTVSSLVEALRSVSRGFPAEISQTDQEGCVLIEVRLATAKMLFQCHVEDDRNTLTGIEIAVAEINEEFGKPLQQSVAFSLLSAGLLIGISTQIPPEHWNKKG